MSGTANKISNKGLAMALRSNLHQWHAKEKNLHQMMEEDGNHKPNPVNNTIKNPRPVVSWHLLFVYLQTTQAILDAKSGEKEIPTLVAVVH